MLKKIICFTVVALCLGLVACDGVATPPSPQNTAELTVTPDPDVQASPTVSEQSVTRVVYYPEDATPESADYILTYTLAQFPDEDARAQAMNAALVLYEEELIQRVATERVPYADRVQGEPAPYTNVASQVSVSGGYTNIVFTETFGYSEEDEDIFCFTLVLDAKGEEVSFYEVTGLYTPEDLVAQQVWNILDREDASLAAYYGDLSIETIRQGLDLYNGYVLTDTGYSLYFQPGVLAGTEAGVLTFAFDRSAVYPDFVGEALGSANYEALLPAFRALAYACGINFQSFSAEAKAMDPYSATVFMSCMYEHAWAYTDGFAYVEQKEYEAAFEAWFGLPFPTDLSLGNGTVLEDGKYRIPEAVMFAEYGLRLDDARESGNMLSLTGMLYSGAPGTAEATELSVLSISLKKDNTPAGYRIEAFEVN